ncbi:RHS repeat-associated core domain-containing protein [Pasteurella sp. PK-2025]|uniref:RHS repeat-associated core domain-containing protein n=1 Tax=Pasteurella sp. PK-2025 TaxID=3413133 RepID=UPI003C718278
MWYYQYDALGRRISKACPQQQLRITYLWDGDQLAYTQTVKQDKLISQRHSVFHGWQLIAQQDRYQQSQQTLDGNKTEWKHETHYAICQPNGQVLALLNQQGKLKWKDEKRSVWGLLFPNDYRKTSPLDPQLLFAGQYTDPESGLAYNRFRYYDPESGNYISSDPIGLNGGEQPYRYVHNVLDFLDPFGLAVCPLQKLKEKGYTGVRKTPNGGLDYSKSNALYTNQKRSDVNPIQRIEYTGNYHKDFELANMAALGQKSTPKGYTWHHLDDYDPVTNSGTIQLVKTEAHTGIPHRGGVAQYKEATGNSYVFKLW